MKLPTVLMTFLCFHARQTYVHNDINRPTIQKCYTVSDNLSHIKTTHEEKKRIIF